MSESEVKRLNELVECICCCNGTMTLNEGRVCNFCIRDKVLKENAKPRNFIDIVEYLGLNNHIQSSISFKNHDDAIKYRNFYDQSRGAFHIPSRIRKVELFESFVESDFEDRLF